MARGPMFTDIRPRAANFAGVDPGASAEGLVIPPIGRLRVGQQVYCVVDFFAQLEGVPPGDEPYIVGRLPLWLRPQTQFRAVGFNWPPHAPLDRADYASNIYQAGVETGADGLSFGTPADDATPAGRLANWLAYDPLWVTGVRRIDSVPDSPGPEPPPSPPGFSYSTLLDEEWTFAVSTASDTLQLRRAFWATSYGFALQLAASQVVPGPNEWDFAVPAGYPALVPDTFRSAFQYKIGDANSVYQQDSH